MMNLVLVTLDKHNTPSIWTCVLCTDYKGVQLSDLCDHMTYHHQDLATKKICVTVDVKYNHAGRWMCGPEHSYDFENAESEENLKTRSQGNQDQTLSIQPVPRTIDSLSGVCVDGDSDDEVEASISSDLSSTPLKPATTETETRKKKRKIGKKATGPHKARKSRKSAPTHFDCTCGWKTDRHFNYHRHVLKHCSFGATHFNCTYCDKEISQDKTKSAYGVDFRKCTDCGQNFYKLHEYSAHVEAGCSRLPAGKLLCLVCRQSFKLVAHIEEHIRTNHLEDEMPGTNNIQRVKSMRGRTDQQHNTGKPSYECNVCDWGSVSHYNFHRHYFTHMGGAAYTCWVCNKRIRPDKHTVRPPTDRVPRKKSSIRPKKKSARGQRKSVSVCEHCGFTTARSDVFSKHQVEHVPEEQRSVYRCEQCPYESFYHSSLRTHVSAKHEKKGPLELTPDMLLCCELCADFTTQSRDKMMTHKHICRLRDTPGCVANGSSDQNTDVPSSYQSADVPSCNQGADVLSSYQGTDVLSYNQGADVLTSSQVVNAPTSSQGADLPSSNQGADVLSSNQGVDVPSSNQGADVLSTNQGVDVPSSSQGADVPSSNQGADVLSTNQGVDVPSSSQGAVVLSSNRGVDVPTSSQVVDAPSSSQGSDVPNFNQDVDVPNIKVGRSMPGGRVKKNSSSGKPLKLVFVCDYCDFVCERRWNLIRHKECLHARVDASCELCGYTTKYLPWLDTHYRKTHYVDPPPEIAAWVQQYRKTHTKLTDKHKPKVPGPRLLPKKEICHLCGKCMAASALKKHMTLIHGRETSAQTLTCHHEGCMFTAVWSSYLARHIRRVHMGLQPPKAQSLAMYKCEYCDVTCKTKRMLTRHMKEHHKSAQDQTSSLDALSTTTAIKPEAVGPTVMSTSPIQAVREPPAMLPPNALHRNEADSFMSVPVSHDVTYMYNQSIGY